MKKMAFWQGFGLMLVVLMAFSGASFAQRGAPDTPEIATPVQKGSSATGSRIMVVSAHPAATQAGYQVLKSGGSAADAAVAVQLVLGLVEPQSSGIGGGGFALYYNAATREVFAYDGRETAPETAGKYLFTGEDGKPMDFYDAAIGGRAVGVPGTVRLLEMLHQKYGVKPWRDLFSPAITLAETGFTVGPRLAAQIANEGNRLKYYNTSRLYFYPDAATPLQPGQRHANPPYASILRRIALEGPDAFYKGDNAEAIAKQVREDEDNPGLISIEDLANYKAIERKAVCGPYRGYTICSVGEPSSGGLSLLETLGMLEQYNLSAGPKDVGNWHTIGEASRLAFADRNYYMADPHYVQSPGERLIDPAYLKSRAALISPDKANPKILPGTPPGWGAQKKAQEPAYPKPPGTTHFVIVDAGGNILSMTSSIEDAFGSRVMVNGYMLNNQLTDFSFVPEIDGKPVANRVEGGKRPRSTMTPVIVFSPDGRPFMAIGSAGGSAIMGYVLERIIAVIDWKQDIVTALAAPNVVNRGKGFELEMDAAELIEPLRAKGHPVEMKDLNSGLTAITFSPTGQMTGAADPRREGTALGE